MVQEALTNAAKHAHATVVSVMVRREPKRVAMVIEDNGSGMKKRRKPSTTGGLGLVGIRERVGLLDGKFTVESTPGRGAALYIEIPLREGG